MSARPPVHGTMYQDTGEEDKSIVEEQDVARAHRSASYDKLGQALAHFSDTFLVAGYCKKPF